ncbi:3',5'-cyclic nucleotide phosphodiesterase, putative [Babesia caballi]|uniref:Phosphodiesterase n=1 Tax=Babesia caballi TaxID=5871 RepID=A0AAV4LZJ6_BABCB|nr:3',5'-cyclic nucleotide phosphodiesterase, putative [Babesia caballi]
MTESSPLDTDFVGPGEFGHIVDPDAFDADVREAAAGLPHVWPPTARPTKGVPLDGERAKSRRVAPALRRELLFERRRSRLHPPTGASADDPPQADALHRGGVLHGVHRAACAVGSHVPYRPGSDAHLSGGEDATAGARLALVDGAAGHMPGVHDFNGALLPPEVERNLLPEHRPRRGVRRRVHRDGVTASAAVCAGGRDMQSGVKLNSAQGRRYFAKLRQLLEDCMSQLRSGENLYGLCYGKHEMGEEQIEIMDAYLVSSKHRLSTQNMTLQFQMTATGSMVGRPALVSAATTERMASVDMSNIDAVDYNTLTSDWNFDVLGYFEQAPRGFVSIGCSLLGRYLSLCDVDKATVVRFLGKLESMYRDVPYHNKIHGAMVAQKWMCLAKYTNLLDHLSVQDEALCVVAAIAHDVGHPGRNNAFFVRAHHPVAHLYNDNAVLENYHAACTLRILRMPGCNIFADIDYDYVRSLLIELILATDTVNNFEMNSQFVLSCSRADFSLQDLKARMLTGKMLIKAADVSAPTMPWAISLAWVGRLLGEFYAQGAEEAQMGLPVSALCDRAHHDQAAKSQAAFLKIVVSPLYKSIASLGSPAMDEIMRQAEENTERWQEMDKSGETIPCVDCEESEANLDVSWVLEPAAPQR